MKGEKYLSEIGLTSDRFMNKKINIIVTPTGAGKTYFAFNELPKLTKSNHCILYLTDTNMNKEQILNQNENTVEYQAFWRKFINDNTKEKIIDKTKIKFVPTWGTVVPEILSDYTKIHVMNYAKVAGILHYGHPFDWSKFDYVVCDELQNLIRWQNIIQKDENGKPVSVNSLIHTQRKIEHTLYNTETTIIALTATPDKVIKKFNNYHIVLTPQEYNSLYQYETFQSYEFNDYIKVFDTIPQGKKGIVYFAHIKKLIEAEKALNERGHRTACIWSISNKTYHMTDKQLEVRQYIAQNEKIPDNIDILLINDACHSGVNIRNEDISFILIHSTDKDTITQVRGRLRQDLNLLFTLNRELADKPSNPLPAEYLNRPLTVKEKEYLCVEIIRYISPKGVPYKWKGVKPYLESLGYTITDKTIKNTRVSVIEKR